MAKKWASPTDTGTYSSWLAMRGRCLNPNNQNFRQYGGNGIGICAQWEDDFDRFYADMGDRPASHTLERINGALGYTPENCRWATRAEQVKNRVYTITVTHSGETKTLAEWAKSLDVPYYTLWNRIRSQGMSPEKPSLPNASSPSDGNTDRSPDTHPAAGATPASRRAQPGT